MNLYGEVGERVRGVIGRVHAEALRQVELRAEGARGGARVRLLEVLGRAGFGLDALQLVGRFLRERARVTLNFHPDRPLADGRTVAECLLVDGRYRSQFVTGISNGDRSAFSGGARDGWEARLFGGVYQDSGVDAEVRPKYGGLNLMQHEDGACPRFGSCYFELHPRMLQVCTHTWGDSHLGPEHVGTLSVFEPIWAALLEEIVASGEALGVSGLDVASFVSRLAPRVALHQEPKIGRALDAYIEAQVHAEIDLTQDVDALVIDPAFLGTQTYEQLRELCERHQIALRAHAGFVLRPSQVPADFRGPEMVPFAARVMAQFGDDPERLDAVVLGRAARSLRREPETWLDWATPVDTLQHIKQLWHVLVRFGQPRSIGENRV